MDKKKLLCITLGKTILWVVDLDKSGNGYFFLKIDT